MTTPNLNPEAQGSQTSAQGNQAGAASTATQPPFDLQALLGDELRADPMLAPFKTVVDLAKSYKETKSLVGADTMRKLSKHATDEDRVNFLRKAFDVPAELEKYEVKLPKGVSDKDEFFVEMKKKAFQLGIPSSEFSSFANRFYEFNEQKIADMKVAIDDQTKTEWDAVKKRYGQAFDQKMAIAQNVIKEFAGADWDAVKAEMQSKGWQSSPWLAELMVRFGEFRYNEDQIKGMTKGGKLSLDPKEAASKIREINGNKEHPYHNRNHPNHDVAVKEVEELFKIQYSEEKAG